MKNITHLRDISYTLDVIANEGTEAIKYDSGYWTDTATCHELADANIEYLIGYLNALKRSKTKYNMELADSTAIILELFADLVSMDADCLID